MNRREAHKKKVTKRRVFFGPSGLSSKSAVVTPREGKVLSFSEKDDRRRKDECYEEVLADKVRKDASVMSKATNIIDALGGKTKLALAVQQISAETKILFLTLAEQIVLTQFPHYLTGEKRVTRMRAICYQGLIMGYALQSLLEQELLEKVMSEEPDEELAEDKTE